MNDFIAWFTLHNTLIIQLGFSVILILIVIYVYRLFFVSSADKNSIELAGNVDLNEVAKKMALVIQQQKGIGTVAGSTSAHLGSNQSKDNKVNLTTQVEGATSAAEEVVALKAEVMRLQTQLNEAERKVFDLAPTEGKSSANTEAAFGVAEASGKTAASATGAEAGTADELNKKIEQLQARLSEYDIIADDIAELSQLRAENTELKKKLAAGGESKAISQPVIESVTPTAEVSTDDSAKPSVITETEVNPPVLEPTDSTEIPTTSSLDSDNKVDEILASVEQQKTEDVALASSENTTEALSAEPSLESSVAEPSLAQLAELTASLNENSEISEADKNLMSDFEKLTQKG